MSAESHGYATNREHNTLMEVPQPPASQFPSLVEISLLQEETSPKHLIPQKGGGGGGGHKPDK